jgi:hypothetical protein
MYAYMGKLPQSWERIFREPQANNSWSSQGLAREEKPFVFMASDNLL